MTSGFSNSAVEKVDNYFTNTLQIWEVTLKIKECPIIISKKNLQDSIVIDWIPPGNYNVRVFIDENNNNHWDSGNILSKEMSEKIIIYPQIIKVKANWEIDVVLDEP